MTKEKKYERKRITRHITLSQEAHEFLQESVTNASRFIESLIMSSKNKIEPVIMTVSRIGDAANRTRTCDMLVNSQPLYQLSYGGTGTSAL